MYLVLCTYYAHNVCICCIHREEGMEQRSLSFMDGREEENEE